MGFLVGCQEEGHYSPVRSANGSPRGSPNGSPNSHRRPIRAGSQPLLSLGEKSEKQEIRTNLPFVDRCDSLPSINNTQENHLHSNSLSPEGLPRYHIRAGSEPVVTPEKFVQQENGNYLTVPPKDSPIYIRQ